MEEAQKMQQSAGVTCSEQNFSADGRSGNSVCTMAGMTISSSFTVTGDVATAYTLVVDRHDRPGPSGHA